MRLKLVYFPVRAKCESIRLALLFGSVAFEDVSVKDHFGKSWAEGAKAQAPFGQLPLLVVDDAPPLAQSGAIMRYICRELVPELTPNDPLIAARCDMLFEASQELVTAPTNVNPIVNVFCGDTFQAKKAEYFELVQPKLANLETIIAASEGPFFLGAKPFYCDLGLFHVLDNTLTLEPTALDKYPALAAFVKSVAALPAVAAYLEDRPDAVDIGTAPMLKPKP
jgi:glutathione S-transferase